MTGTKLRFGVLSTANIGKNQVNPAIQASRNAELIGVASRDAAKAREFAAAGNIPRHYGSYEALLDDSNVEAVYIPLPNSMHREWTVRAAEKGKHVLCEKPLATTAADCREMQAACDANGVVLMEAFMYRFHPRTRALLDLVRADDVGGLRAVRSAFTFKLLREDNIRWFSDLGGGALFDLGCYCVDATRRLMNCEPVEVSAFAGWNEHGVDRELSGLLRFEDGATAHFDCSFSMERREFVEAACVEATFTSAETFVNSTGEVELVERRGRAPQVVHKIGGDNHYRLMVEHFVDVTQGKAKLEFGIEHSVGNLNAIEALYASARAGGVPVKVAKA